MSFTRLSDTPSFAFPVKLGSRATCTYPQGNVVELGATNECQFSTLSLTYLLAITPTFLRNSRPVEIGSGSSADNKTGREGIHVQTIVGVVDIEI